MLRSLGWPTIQYPKITFVHDRHQIKYKDLWFHLFSLNWQKKPIFFVFSDGSLDGACIISALKLPSAERAETTQAQPEAHISTTALSNTSDLDTEAPVLPHTINLKTDTISEGQTGETTITEANWTAEETGAAGQPGDIIKHEDNLGLAQRWFPDVSLPLKQCHVQLKRLELPLPFPQRPVRRNRGLRMERILLEEKKSLYEDVLTTNKSTSTKPSDKVPLEALDSTESSVDFYMAPISDCSEDDSWSYYSDMDSSNKTSRSPSMTDSWSSYSDDECALVTGVRSCAKDDSLYSCSTEDPFIISPRNVSTTSRKQGNPNPKAIATKKARQVQCLICREFLNTSLRIHMKTHFPTDEYACPRCDSRFKFYSSFKLHLNRTCYDYSQPQVDPERPDQTKSLYKCDKCGEAFRFKVALGRHKLTHNELYCNVCRKVLRDASTLARHKASHTLFQCNRCEESFTLFKPLLRHYQNVHKISKLFKCTHCAKTLSNIRNLIAHEWRHTGHLPFQCAHCGLRCKTDADLMSHERVHTREKPYLCTECGKTFSQKSNLLRHLNLIHSESRNEKKHSCSVCEKSFKEKGALKKHQRSKHSKELFRHPCPYCGKMVSTSTMARHVLIHTGARPFKCTMLGCDKDFRSSSEVKNHVLRHHSADRPYKCDICGKGFIKMCFLNSHAKIHTGEKPFVCTICGKAFPKLYSMQRHQKLRHAFVTQ